MNDNLSILGEIEQNSIQTIITQIENSYKSLPPLLKIYSKCKDLLKEQGTLWIFTNNIINNSKLIPIPFILCNNLKELGYVLKNLIVYYNLNYKNNSVNFENRYSHIIFLTKQKDNYKFNKDPIREKHIWKNVEWSGGRKSRYNEKGKDPSNFWLKTKDNGKGKIIEYLILKKSEAIDRIIKATTSKDDKILFLHDKFNKINNFNENFLSVELKFNFLEQKDELNLVKSIDYKNHALLIKNHLKSNIFIKSSENMNDLPDNTIQSVITSPPYWGLRDYDHSNQIGYNSPYIEYLNRLNKVWKECYRVLKNNGTLWININKRVKEGNMILFPYNFYTTIEKIGFSLLDIIIWHKPIAVSAYGEKNLGDRYEFILLFSKTSDYKFNKEIKLLHTPDYIHLNNEDLPNIWRMFRKIGNIGREVSLMIKNKKIRHTAIYPKELVRRIILLSTNKGDYILDPFAGSGTTLVVANKLFRNWIGYEINPNYVEIMKYRLKAEGKKVMKLDEFL
ncbi:MAG: hypothetical protein CEE42_04825 [Promethearchaeota archaeon Loki_b31]|nr:MAG: hypothetical protein CEE42_04825 [Candidatus Lokiarchaeota archaeon Loki_b31]